MPVIPGPTTPDPIPTDSPPCGAWCVPEDLRCSTDEAPISHDDAVEMIEMASSVLYEFTQHRWPGVCEAVIRPCAERSRVGVPIPSSWRLPWPMVPGQWSGSGLRGDWGWCGCWRGGSCGCTTISEIDLKNDIVEVTEVKVNGEILETSEYELQAGRYLVAIPPRSWPCCQHLDRSDDDDGTMSIAVRFGAAPPRTGRTVAAALACEMAKAFGIITGNCSLDDAARSVARQGVTIVRGDPLELFPNGMTGVRRVDLWIQSVVQGSQHRPGVFHVPGRGNRGRRQS